MSNESQTNVNVNLNLTLTFLREETKLLWIIAVIYF